MKRWSRKMKTIHNGPQLTLRTLETTVPKERSEPVRRQRWLHSEQHWLSPTSAQQKRLNLRNILSRLRARAARAYLQSHRASTRDPDHKPAKRPQMVHVVYPAWKAQLVAVRDLKKSSVCRASKNPPFQHSVQHNAWDQGAATQHAPDSWDKMRPKRTHPEHYDQTLFAVVAGTLQQKSLAPRSSQRTVWA